MRVQVNLSDEMVRMVDDYAKLLGVTRSSLCSMLIGDGVLEFQEARYGIRRALLLGREEDEDEKGQ